MSEIITEILNTFESLKLEEMDKVRLMDRYDTKFLLPASRIPDLLNAMNKKYRVLEINGERIACYNTVYLDTHDYMLFNQHVSGRNGRSKIRYRSYVSTGVSFLEIKTKTKRDRTVKKRIENKNQPGFFNDSAIQFINKHLALNSEELKPVLLNSFKRITFTGDNPPERITVDFGLEFSLPGGEMKKLPFICIVELKSEGLPSRSPFSTLAKELSLYPTGFSKYCIGNAMLYDLPKKNNLKPKFLLINRIENEHNRSISA